MGENTQTIHVDNEGLLCEELNIIKRRLFQAKEALPYMLSVSAIVVPW